VPLERAEVARIAALARVPLSDEEADRVTGQLADILRHIDVLREAERGDPAPHGASPDAGEASTMTPPRDPLLVPPGELAPGWHDPFFTVPLLAGHGGLDASASAAGTADGSSPVAAADDGGPVPDPAGPER
jgi:hypothetical protein